MIVWLVGMMGSGKSTVGPILADRLGIEFVDLDRRIESRIGSTISEFWDVSGEESFREIETETAREVSGPAVVSTGGGIVTTPGGREVLVGGPVVWLAPSMDVLVRRLGGGEGRPLLASGVESTMRRLLAEREGAYGEVADVVISEDLPAGELAARVIEAIGAVR